MISPLISESVAAGKARAEAAQKANDAAAKTGGFKPSGLGDGVAEKIIRDEVIARQDAIVAAAVAEAVSGPEKPKAKA